MLSEGWHALSVLYVCPIRALLNNLELRLSRYAGFVSRRVELWHGDVGEGTRRHIRRDPPDILLTTPESMEVMLVSRRGDRRTLFRNVAAVVVDELHAFAGDDRGWHLLSVLERIERLAGREIQRVGLSATIGNPTELLDWLTGNGTNPRRIIGPVGEPEVAPDLTLDYVGTTENAAKIVAHLHRGDKRLVFVDSRARVEQVAAELRARGVATFVSHSSLSTDERRRAETAFAEGSDCVIVATSSLELGIDVGDLDRVIQIDAPTTVSAFLQRLGRTGRRPGSRRNCLFLATSDDAFLRAAGMIQLRSEGYVEPVTPPAEPYHILAQQLMALALQEGGIGRTQWGEWIGRVPAFATMSAADTTAVVDHMIGRGLLFDDAGILSIGPEGERSFGYRNFMEIFSVFTTPPLFTILYGGTELGQVHEASFLTRRTDEPVLLLAGRNWQVTHVDWLRRLAYVEPTEVPGRSRWLGGSGALHFDLCRAIRHAVLSGNCPATLSSRAGDRMRALHTHFAWLDEEATAIVRDADGILQWWTFAGLRANAALAEALRPVTEGARHADNLSISFQSDVDLRTAEALARDLKSSGVTGLSHIPPQAIDGLKFSVCLPQVLAERTIRRRIEDQLGVTKVLSEPVRCITLAT
jgi:ATP-dependent Lhr-like helicase